MGLHLFWKRSHFSSTAMELIWLRIEFGASFYSSTLWVTKHMPSISSQGDNQWVCVWAHTTEHGMLAYDSSLWRCSTYFCCAHILWCEWLVSVLWGYSSSIIVLWNGLSSISVSENWHKNYHTLPRKSKSATVYSLIYVGNGSYAPVCERCHGEQMESVFWAGAGCVCGFGSFTLE